MRKTIMRVTFKRGISEIAPVKGVTPVRATATASEANHSERRDGPAASSGRAVNESRESAFDAQRVAQLRAALAEGRIEFDAAKLAELIHRYHLNGSKT
jgi:negative regulator of flagellin synthesis FlgM